MKKICIIGCGNIGSRHLQGIAKIRYPLSIDIVEPNKKSKKIAKIRLEEINKKKIPHKISWYNSIDELKNNYDLIVLSTTSENRVKLFSNLVERGNRVFLLEKIVCQSIQDYKKLLKIIHKNKVNAWVNTPRRYMNSYIKLRKKIQTNKKLFLDITSGNSGLGTNAIHFLDLFSWLTKDEKIKIVGTDLEKKIYKNKRNKEFFEFGGNIFGKTTNGSVISIKLFPTFNLPTFISIQNNNLNVIFDELNSQVLFKNFPNNQNFNFKMELLQNLTKKIVTDILEKNECKLPKTDELLSIHSELFKIFNKHIMKITGKKMIKCPIT